jgi:hypothetical protein
MKLEDIFTVQVPIELPILDLVLTNASRTEIDRLDRSHSRGSCFMQRTKTGEDCGYGSYFAE